MQENTLKMITKRGDGMYCWECQYFEYDEIFHDDTCEEDIIIVCRKNNDCDKINDYKECKDFVAER